MPPPGLHSHQEFIHVKICHEFASFDLIKPQSDLFAQRIELDAIKLVLRKERSG